VIRLLALGFESLLWTTGPVGVGVALGAAGVLVFLLTAFGVDIDVGTVNVSAGEIGVEVAVWQAASRRIKSNAKCKCFIANSFSF
jgi:hypothetical protein